jgi:transposase
MKNPARLDTNTILFFFSDITASRPRSAQRLSLTSLRFQNSLGPSCTEPAGLVRSGMSYDLIDDAIWERLAPLIPPRRRRRGHRHGRTPIPDRAILTGILFVLRSGIPWQMLPRRMGCGSGSSCWRRLVRWQRTGVWRRLHETLLAELRKRGRLDQRWAIIDSASVRAVRGGKNWTEPYRSP